MSVLSNATSICFSSNELWFLISQFPMPYLQGMENPYQGYLTDEIALVNQQAIQSLVDRGLVRVRTEDTLDADDIMMELVHTCVEPNHTLVVQTQTEQCKELQRFIHFREDWIVEHIQESVDQHRLTVFKNRDSLTDYLSHDLRVSSVGTSRGKSFFLPEDILFAASQYYLKGQDEVGLAALEAGKLAKDRTACLAATLADPVANASFTFIMNMQNENTQYVKGFGLLEGREDFWILSPCERSGKQMVECIPANSGLVLQRFLEMLPA